MKFGEHIVKHIIEYGIEPAFIDEIGPLELENKGFYTAFSLLLKMRKDVYAVVRESCLQNVIIKFNISNLEIIRV